VCFGYGDEKKLGPHCKIRKKGRGFCLSSSSVGATLLGWACRLNYVCRKCGCNMHNAMCSRHGVKQPPFVGSFAPVLLSFLGFMPEVRRWYEDFQFGGFDGWLLKWPEGKRKQIVRSVEVDPILASRVKNMVKLEGSHAPPTRPRAIQMYANLATQSLFGYVFYAAQKAFARVFNMLDVGAGVDVTLASGMNSEDIGAWMSRVVDRGCVSFYERDGKNWDSTMQMAHFELKLALFERIDPDFAGFVRSCVDVRGSGVTREGFLQYTVRGTVKSGHNDTTLGNGLVNAAIAVAACWRLGLRASIIVAGDDLLMAVYSDFSLDELMRVESEFGIVPVARKFSSPFDVSFISGVWFPALGGFAFGPKPGRLVARLFWTVNPPSAKKKTMYLRSVCKGLLPTCSGYPVVRIFLHKFDSDGEVMSIPGKRWCYSDASVEWDGRLLQHFALRYHVSKEALLDCERWLRSLPPEPLYLSHPVLDSFMAVDLADVVDRPLSGC